MSYNVYKLYGNYIFRTKDCIVEFIADQYMIFFFFPRKNKPAAVPTDAESHRAGSVRAGEPQRTNVLSNSEHQTLGGVQGGVVVRDAAKSISREPKLTLTS